MHSVTEHLSFLISLLSSSSVVSSLYNCIFFPPLSLNIFTPPAPLPHAPFFLPFCSVQFKSKSGDLRGVKSWGVKHQLVLCKPLRRGKNPTQSIFLNSGSPPPPLITLLAASPLLSLCHGCLTEFVRFFLNQCPIKSVGTSLAAYSHEAFVATAGFIQSTHDASSRSGRVLNVARLGPLLLDPFKTEEKIHKPEKWNVRRVNEGAI